MAWCIYSFVFACVDHKRFSISVMLEACWFF